MTATWLPQAQRIPGNDAGGMNGSGARKLLLHSTEGTSIDGAVGAYRAKNVWPHLTVDCRKRRVVQHLALEVAARSLLNQPGGVQTNKEGAVLVQIELVGFATNPTTIGTPDDLDWFGRTVVHDISELMLVPLRSTVRWTAYPQSYGVHAAQRLSPSNWVAYSGILGHQHAAENEHGDPGALDVARIIRAATGTTPPSPTPTPDPEEDDVADGLLYTTDGKPTYFLHAGKSVGLNEATDLATFGAAKVPTLRLDDDTFAKFRAAYPGD